MTVAQVVGIICLNGFGQRKQLRVKAVRESFSRCCLGSVEFEIDPGVRGRSLWITEA